MSCSLTLLLSSPAFGACAPIASLLSGMGRNGACCVVALVAVAAEVVDAEVADAEVVADVPVVADDFGAVAPTFVQPAGRLG